APGGDPSLADDLDLEPPLPRAVELGQDDALVLAQQGLPLRDAERDRPPEQDRSEVGMAVGAVAVGVAGIVVEVAIPPGDELLQDDAQVVDQRRLELVDEDGHRGVERIHDEHAVPDARSPDDLLDVLGDVQELLVLVGPDRDRVPEHLHRPASLPRRSQRRHSDRGGGRGPPPRSVEPPPAGLAGAQAAGGARGSRRGSGTGAGRAVRESGPPSATLPRRCGSTVTTDDTTASRTGIAGVDAVTPPPATIAGAARTPRPRSWTTRRKMTMRLARVSRHPLSCIGPSIPYCAILLPRAGLPVPRPRRCRCPSTSCCPPCPRRAATCSGSSRARSGRSTRKSRGWGSGWWPSTPCWAPTIS